MDELKLAMLAGAYAITNSRRCDLATFIHDFRSEHPQEISYFKAAQLLTEEAICAQPANDPLALEQLREMHGQPVWVVPNRGIAKWYLVDVANDCCSTCDMDVVDFELYGPKDKSYGWLAYRRPPERSADGQA